MDPFLGEITIVSFNFAPRGWAACDGQILQIAQNQALYSLLGTTYGGNGTTTFALPDLRGRVPLAAGSGTGLTPRTPGGGGGVESQTLAVNNIPGHTHAVSASNAAANAPAPTGNVWSLATGAYAASADKTMKAAALENNAGGQAHENRQPFLVLNFVIAIEGIYPSRD